MPSNFKTYEAMYRLLVAVVAAHPGLKLDYKAIAQACGSDTTASGIEHRFRPIKVAAKAVQACLEAGCDPKDLPVEKKDEIAKFFGGSTKDGIQFQFRAIKSEADRLRVADAEGQDLSLLINSTPVGTPSRNRGTPVKGTATGSAAKRKQAGAAAAAAAAIATPSKKPRTKKAIPAHMQQVETISSDEESSEQVYDELDFHNTPSKTARAERSTEVATTAATDDYTMSGANGAALPANDFGYTPSTTLSPEDDPVTTPGALQPHFVDPMNLNHVHSSQYIGGSGGGDKQPISIGPGYNSFTTTSASTPGGLSSSYHGSSYTESFPTAQYGTNYSSGSFREPYVHNTESPMISGSESLYETGLA